ncbi:hypothetical protein DUI87_04605 [Hirundo rustica rustica]|uniref:Uncharacterized protein n=1 Tax=Hirundo rustica rustica TaxID=333673 RepID=A0A3M0KZH8_HIRRU|nr:hypothetical protein DUI87_04605 [Hirundo rustica rustica]
MLGGAGLWPNSSAGADDPGFPHFGPFSPYWWWLNWESLATSLVCSSNYFASKTGDVAVVYQGWRNVGSVTTDPEEGSKTSPMDMEPRDHLPKPVPAQQVVLTPICVQKERRKFTLVNMYISVQEVKGDVEKCCQEQLESLVSWRIWSIILPGAEVKLNGL